MSEYGRGLSVDMGGLSYWAPLPDLSYRPLLTPEDGGYGRVKKPAVVKVTVDGNDIMHAYVLNKTGNKSAGVDFEADMPGWLSAIVADAAARFEM